MSYVSEPVFVSRALADRFVGIEYVSDSELRVWFHDLLLGHFEPRKSNRVEPIPSAGQPEEGETEELG